MEQDDNVYHFQTLTLFGYKTYSFRSGEEFEEKTFNGENVVSVINVDGNVVTHVQDKKSTVAYVFTEQQMVLTAVYGFYSFKRWFKVEEEPEREEFAENF